MQYIHSKYLQDGLKSLEQRGGKYGRAAKDVYSLLGRINQKDEDPFRGLRTTKNGESRIQHCVKYDLTGFCRLVTVVDAGFCFLLTVGTHEEVDAWLDAHRGKSFGVDKKSQLVDLQAPSDTCSSDWGAMFREREYRGDASLLSRVSEKLLDPLLDGVPFRVISALQALSILSSEDEILRACERVDDAKKQDAILDVLCALTKNRPLEAEKIIHRYVGEIRPLGDVSEEVLESQDLQFVPTDSPEWVQLFEHFARTATYKDWMLFLHPDQRKVVEADFEGPSKLLGVSGSGKTCVVVKRAVRLAQKYPTERILVLTLNRPLAALINELVIAAADEMTAARIAAKPFFEICQELIYGFEPGSENFYSDVTWKSEEHIDAIWREFYRCDLNYYGAAVMQPVHDSLITKGVSAEKYIREEFDWIRSAIPHGDRWDYLELERKGRSFALMQSHRKLLLQGLDAWEEKMQAIGIVDSLGIVAALQPHLDRITPLYRCILVDESQDFGTSELEIIRRLVAPAENDLFICGDAAQQVSSKYQKLKAAGIDIPPSRSNRIVKNYRNSKEVLHAAHSVLMQHLGAFHLESEDFEVLDPEFGVFSGSAPLLLSANNCEEEIASALSFQRHELDANPTWKGCLAIAGYSLYEIQAFGKAIGLPVLDGSRSLSDESLYLSDLAQTKGFEFDVVCVVNVSDGVLPNPGVPEMEQAVDLAQLYVAMTRAKNVLVVSFSGKPSHLLAETGSAFLEATWSEYLEGEPEHWGLPPSLDQLNQDTLIPSSIAEMTAEEFLYTHYAVGLSPTLIERLRVNVGRRREGDTRPPERSRWVDMGWAYLNTKRNATDRLRFGRSAVKEFHELGVRLRLDSAVKYRV